MGEGARDKWRRYRALVADEAMPCALVDLDALEANARTLAAPLRGVGKTLRVATKSVRCPELVRRIMDTAGPVARGLMTYTATETAFWAERGERDLLLAYPVARAGDARLLAGANAAGAMAAVVVDSVAHLELLAPAAREAGTRIPVVLDLDVSWRPLGSALHVGVRRSPLREARDVVALARRITATDGLRFQGVMAYEAQIAGVPDSGAAVRAMKSASGSAVLRAREEVAVALRAAGFAPLLFNGGGTG
jgi:D-serine deaminase-like pyridoxal phosphate-dependent protein